MSTEPTKAQQIASDLREYLDEAFPGILSDTQRHHIESATVRIAAIHTKQPPPLQPETEKGPRGKCVRVGSVLFDAATGEILDETPLPAPTAGEEELRVRIGAFEGWRFELGPTHPPVMLAITPAGVVLERSYLNGRTFEQAIKDLRYVLPDYLHDLNAIASAEARLTDEEQVKYEHALWDLVQPTSAFRGPKGYAHCNFRILTASALQRCRALLHTMGVNCPKCGVAITIENAGEYRTYCKTCVEKLPPEVNLDLCPVCCEPLEMHAKPCAEGL